jgi:hypothetical protein
MHVAILNNNNINKQTKITTKQDKIEKISREKNLKNV